MSAGSLSRYAISEGCLLLAVWVSVCVSVPTLLPFVALYARWSLEPTHSPPSHLVSLPSSGLPKWHLIEPLISLYASLVANSILFTHHNIGRILICHQQLMINFTTHTHTPINEVTLWIMSLFSFGIFLLFTSSAIWMKTKQSILLESQKSFRHKCPWRISINTINNAMLCESSLNQ